MAPSRISPSPRPSDSASAGLTKSQVDFYKTNGYLIIPDALSATTVETLLTTTRQMLRDFPLENHPMTQFTTGDSADSKHVGDDYFLTSHDKIRFFFEEAAFGPSRSADPTSPTTLTKPKHLAINKIGHYLHALSPPFRAATLNASNAALARSLGFHDPRVLQSMVICKQAEIGGAVPPHQDSTFLYTDPPSAVGFWYALEDATVENGCLRFLKGSHRRAPVEKRFVRVEDGGTGFDDVEGRRFPEELEVEEELREDGEYTVGEVKAGSLVLIHGNLLHKSEKNTSAKSRFIYTFHCIEGDCTYDDRNWLQPPEGGFSKLYS